MSESETGFVARGAWTALVTPMDQNGDVDRRALERLVRWQREQGIHGLVPCGTTGEGATLDDDEHRRVIETVVEAAGGCVPVAAGCGSNDTARTVAAARRAREAGADAVLVVSPYYNKPNRAGLIEHYRRVVEAAELPLIVYNVPGRTGHNLGAETILRLAELPGVVAVKEASADLEQLGEILVGRPPGFSVLSGDDALTLPALALGADGVISVVSNEAPAEMARLVAAGLEGDLGTARDLHFRLLPLMRANFVESNPVPVKYAMSLLGFGEDRLRLPLAPAAEGTRTAMQAALTSVGVSVAGR